MNSDLFFRLSQEAVRRITHTLNTLDNPDHERKAKEWANGTTKQVEDARPGDKSGRSEQDKSENVSNPPKRRKCTSTRADAAERPFERVDVPKGDERRSDANPTAQDARWARNV